MFHFLGINDDLLDRVCFYSSENVATMDRSLVFFISRPQPALFNFFFSTKSFVLIESGI